MTMNNIFKMNKNGIINLGRFDAKQLRNQILVEQGEDLGFAIRYYTDTMPFPPSIIFFGTKNGNEIRGLDVLESSKVVYANVIKKFKNGKVHWVLKISNALKGDE